MTEMLVANIRVRLVGLIGAQLVEKGVTQPKIALNRTYIVVRIESQLETIHRPKRSTKIIVLVVLTKEVDNLILRLLS